MQVQPPNNKEVVKLSANNNNNKSRNRTEKNEAQLLGEYGWWKEAGRVTFCLFVFTQEHDTSGKKEDV